MIIVIIKVICICLKVQPVDLSSVSDLKVRQQEVCGSLLASSPIITLSLKANSRAAKPLTVSIPVPPPPVKAKRPGTAVVGTGRQKDKHGQRAARPKSAFLLGISNREGT